MTGTERRYYIAAEESEWDYAPNGDTVTPVLPDHMKDGMVMMEDNMAQTRYNKAMYVAYEDATFTKKVCMPIMMMWASASHV